MVVAREHVARASGGAADDVATRAVCHIDAALRRVGDRPIHVSRARSVGADVVARNRAVIDVVEADALFGVARDDIALGGIVHAIGVGADQQTGRVDCIDTLAPIACGCRAGRVQSDPVALDGVVVRSADHDAGAGKAVDDQAADRAATAARIKRQALHAGSDVVAIQLDHRRAGVIGFGPAVDHHRAGDEGHRIGRGASIWTVVGQSDGVHTTHQCGSDVEIDVVGTGRGVGRRDRLAQRDLAVGARVGDQRGHRCSRTVKIVRSGAHHEPSARSKF